MARMALRIWSAIISTFAVMAAYSPTNAAVAEASVNLGAITAQRSKKPELFLEKASTAVEENIVVAGHSSHRSHASHRSHQSGYGSYGGRSSIDTAPSTSTYTAPATESSPTYKNVAPTVNSKKTVSTKPSSSSSKGIQMIHLNSGSSLDCDYAWQEGDKVNALTNGKVLRFDASEVNIKKTFDNKFNKTSSAWDKTSSYIEVKQLFLKNGASITCDYGWREGDSLNILKDGNVLTFDINEIDQEKSIVH